MMWIYAAIILLVPEAWSVEAGTNQSTSVNSSTPSPKVFEVRHVGFNLGSEVNLTCSTKTWSEMMFVSWNIKLQSRTCIIAFSTDGQRDDKCKDGKSLRNTSSAQSYLHIPKISNDDEGVYTCSSVYSGGNDNYDIHVAIRVPPSTSAWLERKDNKMVAVCKAERGKPAANISWIHMGNSTSEETFLKLNGFFTVESRLEIPEGMDTENLRCAIRHQSWKEEEIKIPTLETGFALWLCILIVVVLIVFLGGFLYCAQKKIITMWRCQQSITPPSKSPPTEDVEEVEPYASYVQRVNSIYNSSADLFT